MAPSSTNPLVKKAPMPFADNLGPGRMFAANVGSFANNLGPSPLYLHLIWARNRDVYGSEPGCLWAATDSKDAKGDLGRR